MSRDDIRRTLATFFMAMTVLSLVLMGLAGAMSRRGLVLGGMGIPVAFAMTLLGDGIAPRLGQGWYIRVSLLLVVLAGGAAMGDGIVRVVGA